MVILQSKQNKNRGNLSFTAREAVYQTNLLKYAVQHSNRKCHVHRRPGELMKNKYKCLLQQYGMVKALKRVL